MILEQHHTVQTNSQFLLPSALEEALVGLSPQARADADQAVKLRPSRNVQVYAATVMAMVADTIPAEKLADELDKSFPLETRVQRYWLPTVMALRRKKAVNAIEALQVTSPYELLHSGLR